jgi:hypothetical protein
MLHQSPKDVLKTNKNHEPKGGAAQPRPKWIPPNPGFAKLNVDAAVSKTAKCGALGVVYMNVDGSVITRI